MSVRQNKQLRYNMLYGGSRRSRRCGISRSNIGTIATVVAPMHVLRSLVHQIKSTSDCRSLIMDPGICTGDESCRWCQLIGALAFDEPLPGLTLPAGSVI